MPEEPSSNAVVRLEEVHKLFGEAMVAEPTLTLLKGFKLDLSGNRDFHKVYFSVHCECGTAGLLSVEVSNSKTVSQIKEVLPGLVEHLKSKEQQFRNMSCETHGRMRGSGRPGVPS